MDVVSDSVVRVCLQIIQKPKTEYQKEIAKHFEFDHILLASWFESLTVTRNTCAHHSRLYNLTFSRAPQIAKEHKMFVAKPGKFYAQAVIMFALLKKISGSSTWNVKLQELLIKFPAVPCSWLDFPENWHQDNFGELTSDISWLFKL